MFARPLAQLTPSVCALMLLATAGIGLVSAGEKGHTAAAFSPLHLAAMRGDAAGVKQLLEAGADINERHQQYRGTPLQYAAAGGHLPVVVLLVRHDPLVDAVDSNGRTPLMWASMKGHGEVVAALIAAGANVAKANDGGWTALHYATSRGHAETANLLIEHGAPKHARNYDGATPWDVANTALEQEETLTEAELFKSRGSRFEAAKIDWTGRWLMTLPSGHQHLVRLRAAEDDRYELSADKPLNMLGLYRMEGGAMTLDKQRLGRDLQFSWTALNANVLLLTKQPPLGQVGAKYLGATLSRLDAE